MLTRRFVFATGASFAVLALAGCDNAPQQQAQAPAAGSPTPGAADPVNLLDGSPVAPLSSEPLMNPAGGYQDRPIGGANARVTVIEYASPTCPHCAAFHINVYPEFKARYIDTGRVKFILRPFVRNVLDHAVFMLAEAAGPGAYYDVIDTFMKTQNQWMMSDRPRDAIMQIALQLGFTKESFEAALTNQELFARMEEVREQALDDFNLTGTPTFFINGKALSGDQTLQQLATEIDPLLA